MILRKITKLKLYKTTTILVKVEEEDKNIEKKSLEFFKLNNYSIAT